MIRMFVKTLDKDLKPQTPNPDRQSLKLICYASYNFCTVVPIDNYMFKFRIINQTKLILQQT